MFPKSYPAILQNRMIQANFFSPFVLEISSSVLQDARELVTSIYQIKESSEYQQKLDQQFKSWPNTPSLLTSFDFHYSPEMGLKLIEINTNASLYLATQIFYQSQNMPGPDENFHKLFQNFVEAFQLQNGAAVDILDFDPLREGLYFEFLLYKEWLEQNGLTTNIISLADYHQGHANKIYNRYTDFYFTTPESVALQRDYENRSVSFSPNPREYFLMADKQRLSVLRSFLKGSLQAMIPESKLFRDFTSQEDLWSERKKYFFKPVQSYGSKGVYNGKGISRKAFDLIYPEDFLAQELCPAGHEKFEHEGQIVDMKFDLRFYTFDGKVQNYVARLYQGQATNMRTPLGGLAPIRFR